MGMSHRITEAPYIQEVNTHDREKTVELERVNFYRDSVSFNRVNDAENCFREELRDLICRPMAIPGAPIKWP
jgi:hypothetical protein